MIYKKTVPKDELYLQYCKLINVFYHFTPLEVTILAELMLIDASYQYKDDFDLKDVISTKNRATIRTKLKLMHCNLTTVISKFKKIGIIVKNRFTGETMINSTIMPTVNGNQIVLTYILHRDDT